MRYVLLVLVIIVSKRVIVSVYFSHRCDCPLFLQVSLHYILSISHEGYGRATSISNIADQLRFGEKGEPPYKTPLSEEYYHPQKVADPLTRKANATFVVLARNSDIQGVVKSMKQAEDRFNKEFNYPWVFLNEAEFDDEFKK